MFARILQLRNALALVLLFALGTAAPKAHADSAIYGGGPFYHGGQAVMDDLRSSGFTTVILFGLHPHENGDLYFNNDLIVSNGKYVGDPGWPARVASLKQAPTSVERIEFSIGGYWTGDFYNIRNLIAAQGTGPGSILYRNFKVLKKVFDADAVNYDTEPSAPGDERNFDVDSATRFGHMLWGLGYSITFAPYDHQDYWVALTRNLAGKVDGIYLQVYAGGMFNDPLEWSNALGMTVDPGLWSRHGLMCAEGDAPAAVLAKMAAWKAEAGIAGGFIWLYDDIQACTGPGSTTADYANAINTAVDGL